MPSGETAISRLLSPALDRWTVCRAQTGRAAVPYTRQRGFTYIGLLVAVAIIGAALATAGVIWQTAQQRERERELLFVGDQFRQAIGRYYSTGRQYPENLEDLLRDPRMPSVARYLRKLYHDPITGTTDWGVVRDASNRIIGVFSQSEARPIKQANFSAADQEFEGKEKFSQWVFVYRPRLARTKPTTTKPVSPPDAGPHAPTSPP